MTEVFGVCSHAVRETEARGHGAVCVSARWPASQSCFCLLICSWGSPGSEQCHDSPRATQEQGTELCRDSAWSVVPRLGPQVPPASRPCVDEPGPEINAWGLRGAPGWGSVSVTAASWRGGRTMPPPWVGPMDPPAAQVLAQTSRKNGRLLPPRAFHLGDLGTSADSPAGAETGQASGPRPCCTGSLE